MILMNIFVDPYNHDHVRAKHSIVNQFLDWVVLDAVNTAGRVLLVWDKRVFEKVDCAIGMFSINVLLKGVADDFVWA